MVDSETEPLAATDIGRVALVVNDLDRMVEFYTTVIGLDVQHRETDRAILGAGSEQLLSLIADATASERKDEGIGLFHTAFLVPSRAALGNALTRVENHWQLDGASDHRVSEALYLSDPEDNGIEVYRDRPREKWPHRDNGMIEIDTLPLDLDSIRDLGREEATVPAETTVGHVHLEVSSISTAREFYVDTLGIGVRQQYGDSALFLDYGDYHHRLGLNVWNGRTSPSTGRGLHWFEFVLPEQDAVDVIQQRLGKRGVSSTTIESGVEVADPDGITLHLVVNDDT
ncbi:VOC family protein [Halococcus saccharolyticus]|uniref:Glyoxalase/bleomycin resistance protein/dioxygenase n=1 Tax=Halococcus saccharolyticus DSM 5350 TaxID=1227455 RepID=M0MLQ8_9EURY|nr:VOC family protein [Halococcus saccharolyticus]EMA46318.1 Glyoxalase/bleomycin resistance protein/dioxygenase [Halococcus saccharolyticus DSM 5350]